MNNAGFPSDFLLLTNRTEASGNEIAIPLKNHRVFFFLIFILPYDVGASVSLGD